MTKPLAEEVKIQASVPAVWDALTNVETMKKWYFEMHDFDLKKGNVFHFYEPGGANKFKHQCEILEILPHQRFKHTWTYPDFTQGITTVAWDLYSDGSGTTVKLTHEGIENILDGGKDFAVENFEAGWKEILHTGLKNFLEKEDK